MIGRRPVTGPQRIALLLEEVGIALETRARLLDVGGSLLERQRQVPQ
jgi:hypothetical protein